MAKITIFGHGTMGSAIGGIFDNTEHTVEYIGKEGLSSEAGDIVILAVRFDVIADILEKNKEAFEGKIIVDIANPLNFETWDELVVPADSSSAQIVAQKLPKSRVIKAFNTTSNTMLRNKSIDSREIPTVQIASDDEEAKKIFTEIIKDTGLKVMDVGSLKRARELEAFGFLQMVLVKDGKINAEGGYALLG